LKTIPCAVELVMKALFAYLFAYDSFHELPLALGKRQEEVDKDEGSY